MLPAWVTDYVGTPFVDRGRDPAVGLDCWGLVRLVLARHFGLTALPDFIDQYTHARAPEVADVFLTEMATPRWQRVTLPAPGDVVVLRIFGKPRHVGVIVAPNRMLSTEYRSGACIEYLDDPRWVGRIDGVYRHA